MRQAMDFNKMRAHRRRGIFLKRFFILAAIVAAVFVVMSLNTFLVAWQFPTQVTGFLQGFGGPGFPIQVPGGVLRDVKALGNDVAVLNDSNLFLYNRNGRELLSVQRMNENTILLARGSRLLTYSNGSRSFQIHFQGRLLLDTDHTNPIISAALGERGNYALVSSPMQHASEVLVFSEQFELLFEWSTHELVVLVDLDPRGGGMAAGSVGARDGELRSTVSLFDMTTTNDPTQVEFRDELILALEYLDHTRLAVITDKGLRVINATTGQMIDSYNIQSGRISLSRISGDYILLFEEDPQYRLMTAILFDGRGRELGRAELEAGARDMQVSERGVYILTPVGVERFDHAMNPRGKVDRSGIHHILLAGNILYYFTAEEIGILGQDSWEPEAPESRLGDAAPDRRITLTNAE
ncbi:MAG: DUF5711 family protein [Oscillospiraceae bacterium]|nr:DUF5711 family protein [Oscillospiraceae bacterium]